MADIGMPGIILLVIVALLLFGPKKLPELGRSFGKTIREFRSGMQGVMSEESDPRSRVPSNEIQGENAPSEKRLPE